MPILSQRTFGVRSAISSAFSLTTLVGAFEAFSAFFAATSRIFALFFTTHHIRTCMFRQEHHCIHSDLETISPVSSSLNSFAEPASVVVDAGAIVAFPTDSVISAIASLAACAAFESCSAMIMYCYEVERCNQRRWLCPKHAANLETWESVVVSSKFWCVSLCVQGLKLSKLPA